MLQGEGVEYLGHANDAVIAISNYRLHIKFKDSVINVSLALPAPSPLAGFQSREEWEYPWGLWHRKMPLGGCQGWVCGCCFAAVVKCQVGVFLWIVIRSFLCCFL